MNKQLAARSDRPVQTSPFARIKNCAMLGLLLLVSWPCLGSVTLVDASRKSVCIIVIPAKANLVEQFAARELQHHLA